MKAEIYTIGLFLRKISQESYELASSRAFPILRYGAPYLSIQEHYGELRSNLFKTQLEGKKTYFYYMVEGENDDALLADLDWSEIHYFKKSSPFKSSLGDVNHSVIDELSEYLFQLYEKRLLGFLWD